MLKRILNKHGDDSADRVGAGAGESTPLDRDLLALSRELSGLARLEVAQAAKERGWSAVQRELERRPVRAARPVSAKGAGPKGTTRIDPIRQARAARARTRRWALGSAAAVVAVIIALLGTYGGGLLQTVENADTGTTVTSVVTSDSTEPSTTIVTDGTTLPNDSPATTAVPDATVTTGGDTPGTSDSTGTSGSSTGTSSPPTTKQPTTTTTNVQQYAAAQREKTAKAAALDLGAMVVYYFDTGDMSGARSLVAAQAQASLVQMISSLDEPYGYNLVGTKSLTSDTVRITLEFKDRVADGLGQVVETSKRFNLTVRVDDEGATIVAISAGS